jgi:hypothetical protein
MSGTSATLPSGATVKSAATVWVETIGDDATGALNDASKPYATVEAAFNAVMATTGFKRMYIGIGSFTVLNTLGVGVSRTIEIYCSDNTTVIFNGAGSFIGNSGAGAANRFVKIYKGIWIYNGGAETFTGNNSTTAVKSGAEYYLYNCTIQNNTATAMLPRQCIREIVDCKLLASVGVIFSGLAGTNFYLTKVERTYILASAGDICNVFSRSGLLFFNCEIISLTGRFYSDATTSGSFNLRDCSIETFSTAFTARPLFLNIQGFCKIKITTTSVINAIVNNSITNGNTCIFCENLLIQMDPLNTAVCISNGTVGYKRDLIVLGKILATNTITNSTIGVVGINFNTGSVTPGNTITCNLYSPYNTDPINYVIPGAATIGSVQAALKALIDAKITTTGTPWNLFTGGDTARCIISGNLLTVQGFAGSPLLGELVAATEYFTETGADFIAANTAWNGSHNKYSSDLRVTQDALIGMPISKQIN